MSLMNPDTPIKMPSAASRILDVLDFTYAFIILSLTNGLGWAPFVNHYLRPLLLRLFGFRIGRLCTIKPGLVIHRLQDPVTIGDHTHLSHNCLFDAPVAITLGRYCDISFNVTFTTSRHPLMSDYRGLRPLLSASPIVVEDYVWVGANCVILQGVRIGRGSVIAAGSIVNRDIPPGVLAGGIPARVIRTVDEKAVSALSPSMMVANFPNPEIRPETREVISS